MNAIGIDWGSSSLRAYLFDSSHSLLEQIESDQGITHLQRDSQGFEQTLLGVVGHWRQPEIRVLLSGMITSRNGWVETPYLPCPARLDDLYAHAVITELEGLKLQFLPGVCQYGTQGAVLRDNVAADVMRGEELQLLAIGPKAGTELVVLPGTHSKWALIDSSSIIAFRTIPTGELFNLLLSHSLIGGLAESSDWSDSGFVDGVECGYEHNAILSQLFSCRSAVLLDQRSPTESRSWLSGLLIGREIREGAELYQGAIETVRLVGSKTLCAHYEVALTHLGLQCEVESRDAAQLGYQRLLQQQ